jgi:hypothetical protein
MIINMAVNDDNGDHSGRIEMIEFETASDDYPLKLECEDGAVCSVDHKAKTISIDGKSFTYHAYSTWAGNMAWDAMSVTKQTAEAIANHLCRAGGWHCFEAWSHIYEAWHAGNPIVFKMDDEH